MSSVTKQEMVEILDEIAEAIETNRSEGVRHMAWRLEQENALELPEETDDE
jgi:hypothetical protein